VELRQIDCFLAVAMDLHFGKAAKRLSLAQSSLSEAITSLEKEVGGQLFVERAGVFQLTPLGEKFRLGVEPAALVLRATLEDCRKTALGQANRLRIGFLGGGLYELTCHLSGISGTNSISMSNGWNFRYLTSLRRLQWAR